MLFASSASNDCECTNTLAHNGVKKTRFIYMKHLGPQGPHAPSNLGGKGGITYNNT